MIRKAVERVWLGNDSSGTPGQEEIMVPLLLPPYPSQYCFPEPRQIMTNLNSSTESDTYGNACKARCLVLCVCCVYLLQNIYLFLFLTVEKTPTEKAPVVPANLNLRRRPQWYANLNLRRRPQWYANLNLRRRPQWYTNLNLWRRPQWYANLNLQRSPQWYANIPTIGTLLLAMVNF